MEIDLFAEPEGLENLTQVLGRRFGLLELNELSKAEETRPPDDVLQQAMRLFNQERYWETHEVLEGLWRRVSGPEKSLLRGIILVSAAFVHMQKDERGRVIPMLERALRHIEEWREHTYRGLDVASLRENIREMVSSASYHQLRLHERQEGKV